MERETDRLLEISYTMGGVIHVLLIIAVVMILFQVIQGRR
jgi:hypothetical protein